MNFMVEFFWIGQDDVIFHIRIMTNTLKTDISYRNERQIDNETHHEIIIPWTLTGNHKESKKTVG